MFRVDVSKFLQIFLHPLNTTTVTVHKTQHLHRFSHHNVTVQLLKRRAQVRLELVLRHNLARTVFSGKAHILDIRARDEPPQILRKEQHTSFSIQYYIIKHLPYHSIAENGGCYKQILLTLLWDSIVPLSLGFWAILGPSFRLYHHPMAGTCVSFVNKNTHFLHSSEIAFYGSFSYRQNYRHLLCRNKGVISN